MSSLFTGIMWKCKVYFTICYVFLGSSLIEGIPQHAILNDTIDKVSFSSQTAANHLMFRPQIPKKLQDYKCAINSTLYEIVDYYPYLHIKGILDRTSTFWNIFSKGDEGKAEIVTRQSPDFTFVCRSVTRTLFPKVGMNKNNKWKFIVNQDKYLQAVRVEICHQPSSRCEIIGEIPSGYAAYCRQKYTYGKLLSLSDRGHPTPDTFKIPSACCCAYRRNIHFLREFGAPVSNIDPDPKIASFSQGKDQDERNAL